jgi:hypothetical protein
MQTPQAAAVLYNDTTLISHRLAMLSATVKVPITVKPYLHFSDLIPGLKARGEAVFNEQFAQHKGRIYSILAEVQLTDISERYKECEESLNRALAYIGNLAGTLKPILSRETLATFVDKLVSIVVNTLKSELARLTDICTAEAEDIIRLLQILSGLDNHLDVQCPNQLAKVAVIRSVFDADLKQMLAMYQAGQFKDIFDRDQIRGLVVAMFEDNAKRTEFLRQL